MTRSVTMLALSVLLVFVGGTAAGASERAAQATYGPGSIRFATTAPTGS